MFIDKKSVYAYSMETGKLLFKKSLPNSQAFMDLRVKNDVVWTGVRQLNEELRRMVVDQLQNKLEEEDYPPE